MNFQRGRSQEEPEINLIPMIDVLLVIIIFLVLTTTYSSRRQDHFRCLAPSGRDTPRPDHRHQR